MFEFRTETLKVPGREKLLSVKLVKTHVSFANVADA